MMNASNARNIDCSENSWINGLIRVVATAITEVSNMRTAHRSIRFPMTTLSILFTSQNIQ